MNAFYKCHQTSNFFINVIKPKNLIATKRNLHIDIKEENEDDEGENAYEFNNLVILKTIQLRAL